MSTEALQTQLDSVNVAIKSELDSALDALLAAKAAVQAARAAEKRKLEGAKQVRKLMRELKLTVADLTDAA